MICSTCRRNAIVGVFSWVRACGRLCTWWQCARCFVAEEQRNAADK